MTVTQSPTHSPGTPAPPSSQAHLHQHGVEIQAFGTARQVPIALSYEARMLSAQLLNRILADTHILYSLYKKTHWNVRGATFYPLHLLLDKHATEQLAIIDEVAERIQSLGAIAVADPRHVAEITAVPRPPDGAEEVPAALSRLLEAHEIILTSAREAARKATEAGDDGTNDMIVSDIIRRHETQVWFLSEHLVYTPLVRG